MEEKQGADLCSDSLWIPDYQNIASHLSQVRDYHDISRRLCCHPELQGKDAHDSTLLPLEKNQLVNSSNKQFQCPESLLKTSFLHTESCSIFETSIPPCCNVDVHKYIYTNTVLSAGTTMCPGIVDKMQKDQAP